MSAAAANELLTKSELHEALARFEHEVTVEIERVGRQLVIWTSSMVLAAGALAFVAGRFV